MALAAASALLALGAVAGGAAYAHWALAMAEEVPPASHMFIAKDGQLLGVHGPTQDEPVRLAELPKFVVEAVLAIEDQRFDRRLLPIDIRGTARAAWQNLRCRCTAQGGSTIGQQLAKQRLHDASPTLQRKFREAVVAAYLQFSLGKQKVLEDYLSSAPFGHGLIGLRAAARGYFNKQPAQLSLGEAAELAALLKAPTKLNPAAEPAANWARARIVLQRMVDARYISAAQAAATPPSRLDLQEPPPSRGYLIDMLEADLPHPGAVGRSGRVSTTVDMGMQTAAEAAVAASAPQAVALDAHEVALVAMRLDGTVLALVGGRNYAASKFNHATQARRPIGSEAKTAIYTAALAAGYSPGDLVDDAPVSIGRWSPRNFDRRYEGWITIRQALAQSRNAASVRLAMRAGIGRVIAVERRAGVTGPLSASQPAFLLGANALSPLELASVFSGLTHCAPVRPRIFDGASPPEGCTPILDVIRQGQLLSMLHSVLTSGTGRAAGFPGDEDCFGKTGTTSGSQDAWFVGACKGVVAAVWVGNDDDSPTQTEGGGLPAAIWRSFMVKALRLDQPTSAASK